MIDPHQLAASIRQKAREIGFDRVGIAPAGGSKYRAYFRDWLDAGQAGSMEYLARRFEERTDPAVYFPGVQSIVCVATNYFVPLKETQEKGRGKIARYALGTDYHEVIKDRLYALADAIRQLAPEAQTRCSVDTAPVMEKELAARAGIGWMGKNTCIINEEIGSWLLLGEVLTTIALPVDEPAIDRCGSCRRCIDACPTGAITEPYRMDARKCISYLTIEHRDEIEPDLQKKMGDWIFGCDICQDVCPWNSKALATLDPALTPRFATGTLELRGVADWDEEDYRDRLRHSAMKRVKLPVLKRNVGIAMGNSIAR
jgi:epoxyqueuosine reductase